MFVSFDPQSGRKATILACNWEKPDSDYEVIQGSHTLEKYLNIQDCLEKSLKIKFALKST